MASWWEFSEGDLLRVGLAEELPPEPDLSPDATLTEVRPEDSPRRAPPRASPRCASRAATPPPRFPLPRFALPLAPKRRHCLLQ